MVQYKLKGKDKNLKKVVELDEYIRFPQELKDKYEEVGVPHPALTDASDPLTEEVAPSPEEGVGKQASE